MSLGPEHAGSREKNKKLDRGECTNVRNSPVIQHYYHDKNPGNGTNMLLE